MLLRTRADAGAELAERLAATDLPDPVVLGLPRGGVPVAFMVAQALQAPLDIIVVRKVGVPHHQELAMGAVGEGDVLVVDQQVVDHARVGPDELAACVDRERAGVAAQAARFRADRPFVPLAGRSVILVDDGVATGSTMLAACRVARSHDPARVVVAIPVAPTAALAPLRNAADQVVCLYTPHPFMAVGLWYHDFTQVTDADVISLLASPR